MNQKPKFDGLETTISLTFSCSPLSPSTSLLWSEINKSSKFVIKLSNSINYIELDIQNIGAQRTANPIIYYVWEIYLRGSLE